MGETLRSRDELRYLQSLPLDLKIAMTKQRLRGWINTYGIEGVYVSFSGGKDSTVLLHIARSMYPDIKAVFIDTGLEYPELRRFVGKFDNVEVVRPKMSFRSVCEKYGFPIISKEVSENVHEARRYKDGENKSNFISRYKKLTGQDKWSETGKYSMYSGKRWAFFLDAPFELSDMCCRVMKKQPIHSYEDKTERKGITAQMTSESRLREMQWLKNGCNGFNMKRPKSNPMAFWYDQDVLEYIQKYGIEIASVYGDIVVDYEAMNEMDGQMMLEDEDWMHPLRTTGCQRTGCILCGYGCHLDRGESRFERLKRTHPNAHKALNVISNSGVTYAQALDWINEHNGKGQIIRY